jgi:hypothetical protein
MKLRSLIFGLTLATTAVVGANEPMSIRVSPAVSSAPAKARWTALDIVHRLSVCFTTFRNSSSRAPFF